MRGNPRGEGGDRSSSGPGVDLDVAGNVRAHRISYLPLALRGALVGVASAVIMAAVTMLVGPLLDADNDVFTFPRVVATIVLGDDAATPLTGLALLPVAVGLLTHLAIGALVGAAFALLIGEFDVEGTVPVMVAGIVFASIVFVVSYLAVARLLFPAFEHLPILASFWSHVVFGIVAGAMLGSWATRFDTGEVVVRGPWSESRIDAETAAMYVVIAVALVVVVTVSLIERSVATLGLALAAVAAAAAALLWLRRG